MSWFWLRKACPAHWSLRFLIMLSLVRGLASETPERLIFFFHKSGSLTLHLTTNLEDQTTPMEVRVGLLRCNQSALGDGSAIFMYCILDNWILSICSKEVKWESVFCKNALNFKRFWTWHYSVLLRREYSNQ